VLTLSVGGELPRTFGYLLLPRFSGQVYVRCNRDAFLLRVEVVIDNWEYQMTCVQDEVELSARRWR
jgi:hypothetical protein